MGLHGFRVGFFFGVLFFFQAFCRFLKELDWFCLASLGKVLEGRRLVNF